MQQAQYELTLSRQAAGEVRLQADLLKQRLAAQLSAEQKRAEMRESTLAQQREAAAQALASERQAHASTKREASAAVSSAQEEVRSARALVLTREADAAMANTARWAAQKLAQQEAQRVSGLERKIAELEAGIKLAKEQAVQAAAQAAVQVSAARLAGGAGGGGGNLVTDSPAEGELIPGLSTPSTPPADSRRARAPRLPSGGAAAMASSGGGGGDGGGGGGGGGGGRSGSAARRGGGSSSGPSSASPGGAVASAALRQFPRRAASAQAMAQTLKGAGSAGSLLSKVGQMLAATAGVKGAKSARERELIAARERARAASILRQHRSGVGGSSDLADGSGLMRAENYDSDGEEDDYDYASQMARVRRAGAGTPSSGGGGRKSLNPLERLSQFLGGSPQSRPKSAPPTPAVTRRVF